MITHPEMLAVARLLIASQRTPGIRPREIAVRLGFPYPSRPHPLDPDIAAVIQGGILERMPQAAREQDPERPDAEIVELIAAVMERGLYNPGPTR